MIVAGIALLAASLLGLQGLKVKLAAYLGFLPFLTWFQIHYPSAVWTAVPTALLVLLAITTLGLRPDKSDSDKRVAAGLTAVVLVYAGVALASAFNPGLPNAVIGLRGARIVIEPMVLFFVGVEAARRPGLRRVVVAALVVTGTIVILYGVRQGIAGFDSQEFAHMRRTFAIGVRERRVFSTMAGASVLGHYVALVSFCVVGLLVIRPRPLRILGGGLVLGLAAYLILLTGQRGVMISAIGATPLVVVLLISRFEWRVQGLYVAAALSLVFGLVIAMVITTPVEDRRKARAEGTTAFEAARLKLALLKTGGSETSAQLRFQRLEQTRDALTVAPMGVGAGLNLLIDPRRSARTTLLGTAGFDEKYQPKVAPIPGELYYFNLASELGIVGLSLWVAIAGFGLVTASGIAVRHRDPAKAAIGLAAAGYFLFIMLDSFAVDGMTSPQVASYFWLLLGMVGRWAHDDDLRTSGPFLVDPPSVSAVAASH